MADSISEVDRVLEQLRGGESSAADELFARFSGQLCGLVHRKLGWRYRRKFEPDDVAQSVFKSFVRANNQGNLAFENWDALWGFLSLIAMRKCGHRIDYLRAACRDVAREHSVILRPADADQSRGDLEVMSREPTPSQAAMLSEALDRLLQPLDDRERTIVTLALQGHDTGEIADQVARSERTVQRILERVRRELEAAAEDA